jgi:ankyrin repeat protein
MLGHSDIVKALIAAKANVNEKGDNFDTPLILASSYGNIFSTDKNSYPNIVKMLLRAKADPNVASIRNLTPLILATMAKNKEVVSALLAAGAKVNTKSDEGITACQYAIESGNLEIVKTLKNAGADCKKTIPDILAKRLTKAEATKQLMEIAKDSYTNVSYDNSHDMYNPSNSKKIKYLLGFGADINIQDDEGYTPLMRILEKEVPDFGIAKMLVNQDADVNLKNNKGETALHIFAQNGIFFSPTLLKKLIRAGTDINTRDDKGKTPLIHLMSKFSPPAECFFIFSVSLSNTSTEILLSSGADVNAKDKDGNTALSCLLQKNNYSGYNNECVALVKTLLKFSADPFIKNNNKKAPIDYVTTDTDPYIIKLLSEKTGLLLPLKN